MSILYTHHYARLVKDLGGGGGGGGGATDGVQNNRCASPRRKPKARLKMGPVLAIGP